MAVDVIPEMGISRDYLNHETTYQNMATQSRVEMMGQPMRENWESDGSTDIY